MKHSSILRLRFRWLTERIDRADITVLPVCVWCHGLSTTFSSSLLVDSERHNFKLPVPISHHRVHQEFPQEPPIHRYSSQYCCFPQTVTELYLFEGDFLIGRKTRNIHTHAYWHMPLLASTGCQWFTIYSDCLSFAGALLS
jgi:hypothetical protein